jgi:DNA-binding response OmpR family regulator
VRLLVLEDDPQVARSLQEGLERAGYAVAAFGTPSDADQAFGRGEFDAAVIDLGLPHEDGLSFIRRIRERGITVPMVILTARDTLDDCISGLDAGADDYMTKPFQLPELLARLRASIRRAHARATSQLRIGRLQVDLGTHELHVDNDPFDLPPRERAVLEALMLSAPNAVRKDQLIHNLVGWETEMLPNAVEVYVSRLRPKLLNLGLEIRAVRGIGYRLEEPGHAAKP